MQKSTLVLLLFLLFAGQLSAQEAPSMFAVYQSQIKPSQDAAYRPAVMKLKEACIQNKLDMKWTTVEFNDHTFVHQVPIKNFADLDKNGFAPLEAKIGKEAMQKLWADIDKCAEWENSFVITRIPDLSYNTSSPDDVFRDVFFWYPFPDKMAEAPAMLKEWMDLYKSKNAVGGFTTYRLGFGSEPGYVVVFWAKNELDFATKESKNNELFGEAAGKLWQKTLTITRKHFNKRGWIQKDLSYSPN